MKLGVMRYAALTHPTVTRVSPAMSWIWGVRGHKSLLLLFFRKEGLAWINQLWIRDVE